MTQIEDTPSTPARLPMRLGRRLSLIGLSTVLLVVVVLGSAGYAGYQAGLSQRDSQARATQSADLDRQYQLGVSDQAAGRYEVAQARFEYILQLDPQYRDAGQRLAQVRAAMSITVTPTRPPATATPSPAPSPTQSHVAADLFAQAQSQSAASDWDGVIATLSRLHGVDPNYEPVKVNGMLYRAFRNRGVAQIAGPDIESGMFDLDKAEAIGPLDSEALNYRAWGRLYLAAQSFSGLNWQQAVLILQELHLIAPNFHDTTNLLIQASVHYAAQLAQTGDQCGAAHFYAQAQALKDDPTVAGPLATAQAACALTPTPIGSVTPGAAAKASSTPTPK